MAEIRDTEGHTADDRARLEAEHGRMWRWKINRPTPEVLARTIENLQAAGFELMPPSSGFDTMSEWKRPNRGGECFPVYVEDGVEYLTQHAVSAYGHWLPPCPKCGNPVNGRQHADDGWCYTCNFWRRIVAVRHEHIITERDNGGRSCLADGGRRSGSTAGLGFGGNEWRLINLATGARLSTNNMWFQGEVPAQFFDELPVTHRHATDEEWKG